MKKLFYLIVVAAMLLILPAAASGQSGITWDSEIIIQNVGTDTAYVTLYYYNNVSAGGGLNKSQDYTIALGQSIKIYPLDVPEGFNGSVVIESTQPVAAIVNEKGDYPTYDGAYEGFEVGSGAVRLPNIQSANSGFYSFFNVQNAGSETTTVTADFIEEPNKGYASVGDQQCTIDPGEACTFSQEPGQGAWTVGKWVGGAKLTSNNGQHIVASANLVHAPGTFGMSSYSGFTGNGSPTAILPNIMNANADYWSGININNGGTSATNITLKFSPEAGYPAIANIVFNGVQPNDTVVQLMTTVPELAGNVKWVGSVEVDGGGQNIFAIVNTLNTVAGELSAWKGFDPAAATDTIHMPGIFAEGGTSPWWTGVQIYNTSTTDAYVDIVYSECGPPYCATAWTPASETNVLIPGRTPIVRLQSGGAWAGKYYFGSATVTSNGPGVVAIVNIIAPSLFGSGEVTNSYNAINR
jgi:hypothetical protein